MSSRGWSAVSLAPLVVVLAIAHGRLWSQALSSAAAAPFQIRQVAYIKASNPQQGAHFGCGGAPTGHQGNSLAISSDGSTMAVGAPGENSAAKGINGNQNDESLYGAGAVYVFTRRDDGWVQQAYIKASNPQQSALFGSVVALSADGNTLAVSAYYESGGAKGINSNQNDTSIPQAGAAYIFTRTGATWSQQAYIKASNTGRAAASNNPGDFGDGDLFGFSLALSADGNTLAAGAIAEDSRASGINNLAFQNDDTAASSGAAYVFTRTGTNWTQQAYIKASNADAGDLFGYSVGLSGDGHTLAVGTYDEDGSGRTVNPIPDNLRNGNGAIYVFERTGDAWRQTTYLKGSRSEINDAMGVSLVMSEDGSTIAAGTGDENCLIPGVNPVGCEVSRELPPNAPVPGAASGAAYVWARTGNTWVEQAFLKSSNPAEGELFGIRLALSADGNTLAVSAPNEGSSRQGINDDQSDKSAEESGAVYFFTRSGATWIQRAYVKASNAHEFYEFGSSVALSRDGKVMAVGSRGEASAARGVNGNQDDNSAPEAGAAYVFSIN
ncbi:MAG TPA: hypothetical protein VJL59_25710 [Anaerolineales bacterium]|nr:hypothetical protein [Anaerolineales bacterium]